NGYAYIGVASVGDCPLVQGQLLQVSLASHQVIHTFNAVPDGQGGGGVWTSPARDPDTGTLYITTGTKSDASQQYAQAMVALKGSDLSVLGSWTIPASQTVYDSDWGTSPVLFADGSGKKLVAATNKNGILYAFDRSNVSAGPIWQRQISRGGGYPVAGDGSVSSGAFSNGMLYYAGGNTNINGANFQGGVRALDPANGNSKWEHGSPGIVIAALATGGGLLVDGGGKTLEVLNASTGALLYSYDTKGIIYGAPIVNDGRIFAGSTDGNVYAFGLGAAVPSAIATSTSTPGISQLTDPLHAYYNNAARSTNRKPSAANIDALGNSYSSEALESAGIVAGGKVKVNGLTFQWPGAQNGSTDNIVAGGQTISLPARSFGTTLAFLGAATGGPSIGTGTVGYSDGSSQSFQLGLSDWSLAGGLAYGNTLVAATEYGNSAVGLTNTQHYVFATAVTLTSGKSVAKVTLPSSVNQGALHIFAMVVAKPAQSFLNSAAISSDFYPQGANLDGIGTSYSAQALQSVGLSPGAKVQVNKVTFNWPDTAQNTNDNITATGQVIALPSARRGTTLGFLGSAVYGPSIGTGSIKYSDGSVQHFQLGFSDWALQGINPKPNYGNTIVAMMPYRNVRTGPHVSQTYIFYTGVALQQKKKVVSFTLPSSTNQGQLHIFAWAINAAGPLPKSHAKSIATPTPKPRPPHRSPPPPHYRMASTAGDTQSICASPSATPISTTAGLRFAPGQTGPDTASSRDQCG
ncbi:MAG: hypothetical protein JWO59_3356, partial [Chloroflexi bacterium]|nr:hypothetical protein [Chloroflexota bacterium]